MAEDRQGFGCALALAIFNLLVLGSLAISFAGGPFSSREQELWYRYGSIALLVLGALLPVVALATAGRRLPKMSAISVVWMLFALLLAVGYLFNSGGGM